MMTSPQVAAISLASPQFHRTRREDLLDGRDEGLRRRDAEAIAEQQDGLAAAFDIEQKIRHRFAGELRDRVAKLIQCAIDEAALRRANPHFANRGEQGSIEGPQLVE